MSSLFKIAPCIIVLMFFGCGENTSLTIKEEKEMKTMAAEGPSIFEAMRDKIEELDRTEGLSGPMAQHKNADGTNAFDEVLKEIAAHDAESGGQVSGMINQILGAAEEELGMDLTKTMTDALENSNDFFGQVEDVIADPTILTSGAEIPVSKENMLKSLEDLVSTGWKDGGLDRFLQEIVNLEPEAAESEWVKEMEKIINNDERDAEVELENIMNDQIERLKQELAAQGYSL